MYQLTADGALPMPESTHYPLADAATAIRVMGGAEHTGKLVLDVPHTGRSSVVVPPEQAQVFRPDGAYIITGGLGGLGLFLAEKMAAAGCGRIVLNSRSQPDARGAGDHRADSRHRGRRRGGVRRHRRTRYGGPPGGSGDRHRASGARRAARGGGGRGRHADQHHRRAHRSRLGTEGLRRVEHAPGHGQRQPLDWFCSFSSAAALVGSPGQGAYAAANSWLDAFTHWRRAQGLPGTAIAWGAWAEIGRATALAEDAGVAITPDEGCARVRGAAAPRPRLHRLCADHGNAVVDRVRPTQPVRRGVPSPWGKGQNGHKQVPGRAERAAPRRVADHGFGAWSPIRSA